MYAAVGSSRVASGEALLSNASLSHISNLVSQHGTDCWWSLPVEELLAPEYRDNGRTYERGTDTLDVWFDSGTSWASSWAASANAQRPAGDARLSPWDTYRVADVVLEGSDQHRGWFQSSLLVGVAAMGESTCAHVRGVCNGRAGSHCAHACLAGRMSPIDDFTSRGIVW